MSKIKPERFEMRTTKEFKDILKQVADKKNMKVPELVHDLVMREAKKEKINPS